MHYHILAYYFYWYDNFFSRGYYDAAESIIDRIIATSFDTLFEPEEE